jgi:hypothetical protein
MSAYPLLLIACSPFVVLIDPSPRPESTKKETKKIHYNLCLLQLKFTEHLSEKKAEKNRSEFSKSNKATGV